MLRINQLSGFGGQAAPELLIATGSSPNTNSPSFTVDLGPPGIKQVLVVFASADTGNPNDPWAWGTGTVGGEPFTYVKTGTQENAGNGSNYTGGVTIRALETSLAGIQTIVIPIVGFAGIMNETDMLALVVRGFSATPIAYDGGDNQVAANGNNFTISTVGARIVIGGAAANGGPGNLQGPGSEVTALAIGSRSLGYDLAPAGGAADVYSFSAANKYIIAGASFG